MPVEPRGTVHRKTHIYFVQGVDGGPIKIGRADDPHARLRELQVGSPVILRLCRAEIAPQNWETRLHQTFAAYRLHGEWFKPHPILANIADAIADESLAGDALELANVTASEDLYLSMACERGAWSPEPPPERPPLTAAQQALKERNEALLSGRDRLTALPRDMQNERYWRDSTADPILLRFL